MNHRTPCERCASPLEPGDLRCAICGRATADSTDHGAAIAIRVLRCPSCSAAVSYDAQVGAPNCSFCDSVMYLEDLLDPVEQTEGYIPFRVTREAAQRRVRSWLANQGFFRPADLSRRATLESIKAIYWVAWICDASAYVTWTADSNEGSGRSAWAPHSGSTRMEFDDVLVSASRGLHNSEVLALAPYISVQSVQLTPTEFEDGTTIAIETFDVQRSGARRRIVSEIQRGAAMRVEATEVPGTRIRKVHTSALLEALETRRLALPAWVFAYRYKGKLYRAVVSGENDAGITGTVPFSMARLLMLIGAIIAAGLIALTLVPSIFGFFVG